MKVDEKMLEIYKIIVDRNDFERINHIDIENKEGSMAYYISDKDFFTFDFDGIEMNKNGCIVFEKLEQVSEFNVIEWLDEVLKIVKEG